MLFGIYLVRRGLISPMQFVEAVEICQHCRPPLGKLALDHNKLKVRHVFQILSAQCETSKPFGRIAVELGLMREEDLAYLLMLQTDKAKPIQQVLLEMGALDAETIAEELARHYHEQADHQSTSMVTL